VFAFEATITGETSPSLTLLVSVSFYNVCFRLSKALLRIFVIPSVVYQRETNGIFGLAWGRQECGPPLFHSTAFKRGLEGGASTGRLGAARQYGLAEQ
jgi:hypothetical protein